MLDKELLAELQKFVDTHVVTLNDAIYESAPVCRSIKLSESQLQTEELEAYINNSRKPAFNQVLFGYIDQKGISDSEVYKKAGLDRRHFSKIRSNPAYRIGKNAVIALAFALELDKKETDKLLSAAGFSLSENDTTDLVILFCLKKRIYDIHDVNQALDYFSLHPLSGAED